MEMMLLFLCGIEQVLLREKNISMHDILLKCEETINSFRRKKKVGGHLKKAVLSIRLVSCMTCNNIVLDSACSYFYYIITVIIYFFAAKTALSINLVQKGHMKSHAY